MSYPFPGWNEGFTTTAPIIFLIRKGQTQIPANDKLILDITPVDQVASVMLAVSAQACVEEPQLVFQAATGDSNPNNMERIIGLVGLDKRKHFEEKESGVKFLNKVAARIEPRPVSTSYYERLPFDVQLDRQEGFVLIGAKYDHVGVEAASVR